MSCAQTIRRGFCPNCDKPLPWVDEWRPGENMAHSFTDCYHCGKAGTVNRSEGTFEEEVVTSPTWKWRKGKHER